MREMNEICGREEDLIGYLYKEATQSQAKDFEGHLQHCASCREGLAEFGSVREAVGEWRSQSLGSLSSHAFSANVAAMAGPAPRRSALAALREFFTLSPVWMRAATAAAVLLFCALAFIATAYFTERPQVVVIETPGRDTVAVSAPNVVANKQPDATVPVKSAQPDQTKNDLVAADKILRQRGQSSPRNGSTQLANKRKQSPQRNRAEQSAELASAADDYLPFTKSSEEDKLPSLADLVNEND